METTTVVQNSEYDESELQTAESFMNHERPLTPKLISSLMHVDVSLESAFNHHAEERTDVGSSLVYALGVLFASLFIAATVGTSFLYFQKIGPFYDPLEAVSKI